MDIISAIHGGIEAVQELIELGRSRPKISVIFDSKILSDKKNPIVTVVNRGKCSVRVWVAFLIPPSDEKPYPPDFIQYFDKKHTTRSNVYPFDTLEEGDVIQYIFDRSKLPELLDLSSVKACVLTSLGKLYCSDISYKLKFIFFYNRWKRKVKKFFIRKQSI